jgi:hypothetical protein
VEYLGIFQPIRWTGIPPGSLYLEAGSNSARQLNKVTLDHDADYSRSFQVRPVITGHAGARYIDFIETLKPKYLRICLDIALRHAAIIGSSYSLSMQHRPGFRFD